MLQAEAYLEVNIGPVRDGLKHCPGNAFRVSGNRVPEPAQSAYRPRRATSRTKLFGVHYIILCGEVRPL